LTPLRREEDRRYCGGGVAVACSVEDERLDEVARVQEDGLERRFIRLPLPERSRKGGLGREAGDIATRRARALEGTEG
jgi:hypothetical protein